MAKPKKIKKLSAEDKRTLLVKRDHLKFTRGLFRETGFVRIGSAADKEFTYEGHTSDFDDVFVLDNIIAVVEYTTSIPSNVSTHLKNKHLLYEKIASNNNNFIIFLKAKFPEILSVCAPIYKNHHLRLRLIYASRYGVSAELKAKISNIVFLDYPYLRYFANIASTIKTSAKYEFLDFLGVDYKSYASRILKSASGEAHIYKGSVLAEDQSHFPVGFKVLSFYMDAESLLSRATSCVVMVGGQTRMFISV